MSSVSVFFFAPSRGRTLIAWVEHLFTSPEESLFALQFSHLYVLYVLHLHHIESIKIVNIFWKSPFSLFERVIKNRFFLFLTLFIPVINGIYTSVQLSLSRKLPEKKYTHTKSEYNRFSVIGVFELGAKERNEWKVIRNGVIECVYNIRTNVYAIWLTGKVSMDNSLKKWWAGKMGC